MNGQILPNSPAGEFISSISRRSDVHNIVEIGTWEGGGSTMCVLQALHPSKHFYTIELYPDVFEKAKFNLKVFSNNSNFHMINGSIINYDEAFWFDHKKEIDFTTDVHAQLWYQKDLNYLKTSKNVLGELPDEIDFLILDGGEWTSYPEWNKLKDRTKIVFLDDSAIFKNKKVRQEILDSGNYITISDELNYRNGFSIFEKK